MEIRTVSRRNPTRVLIFLASEVRMWSLRCLEAWRIRWPSPVRVGRINTSTHDPRARRCAAMLTERDRSFDPPNHTTALDQERPPMADAVRKGVAFPD